MSARCDLTDLLVDQCAHCLGHRLDDPVPVVERVGQPFTARYDGPCMACPGRIQVGDRIQHARGEDGAAGVAHARCTS